MGGAAAAVTVGMTAKNLIDTNREYKQKKKLVKRQQAYNFKTKKNLLEEQLAARRARFGAMGINSTGSATALQNGLINKIYDDIKEDDINYKSQLQTLRHGRNKQITGSLLKASSVMGSKS